MTKTEVIETREWACVADAVSHYFDHGFTTVWSEDNSRTMRRFVSDTGNDFEEVMIKHVGLLDVRSSCIIVYQ
jgi:hypothetical protein